MYNQIQPIKTEEEKNREEENLREILILLEQLFQREEATAKKIIECLYDIATVNWINKNIRSSWFNSCLKYLVRFPKPLAKILGLRLYLQPKCPKLITDWLYSLVEFKEEEAISIEGREVENELLPEVKKSRQEIKLLRQQIRLLTGSLVTIIVLVGGSFIWIVNNLELTPTELFIRPQSTNLKIQK
jgi:hypothetical protein